VLFGTGRRRRSAEASGGNGGADLHSWAAVRSTSDDYHPAAGALSIRSLGLLIVFAALLSVVLSSRDAAAPPSGRIT